MNFKETQEWIGRIRLEAESGGNKEFYRLLEKRVEDRKAKWARVEEGGDFTSAEIVKLIVSADSLIRYIRKKNILYNIE